MIYAKLTRFVGWMLIAFTSALAGVAHAGGVFDSVTGNVTVIAPNGARHTAQRYAEIPNGSVISTGSSAQAVLRFDDESAVVLNQNTQFRVVDYHYDAAKPDTGRSVFDFLKGAARFVTGLIARAEPANYRLRTAQATMGVRGTDFDLASGSLHLLVNHGVVTASNSAGTTTFGAGQAGFISTAATLPVAVPPGQIPAGIASSFAELGVVPLPEGTLPPPAGGEAGGAGGATGSAATAGSSAAVIAIGAAVALGAAGMSHHNEETATHH